MMKKFKIALFCSLFVFCTACGEEEDVFSNSETTTQVESVAEESKESESVETTVAEIVETQESIAETAATETTGSDEFSLNGLQTNLTDLAGSIASQSNDFIGAFSDSTLPVIDSEAALLAAQYLSSGHCWISCSDAQAVLLYIDGLALQMETITYNGSEFITDAVNANWYMTAGDLVLVNAGGESVNDYTWSFDNEEELNVFTITDSENNSYTFFELQGESMEAGEAMAESFLENEQSMEEISDYSTVLAGYEGVSIVDAFVAAGLNPSFENRAKFAKELGIENYKGTAEQNLSLITLMGGKVK